MKLPKFFFVPTWRIKNSHVGLSNSPRGYLEVVLDRATSFPILSSSS